MRRLYRSRTDRWIAGVCGGLAAYLDVDVSAVRLAFVLLAFWNGLGVILYLVLLVLLPDEPVPEVVTGVPPAEDEPQRRARILGALLVVVGAYLLAQQTPVFTVLFRQPWAGAVLVVGGLLVLLFWPRR
jgi:phage shock protein PspC (stress-responsive transcriptional regulator)